MQAPAQRYVGHRVARVEDPRLLTGHGKYVDDVTVPGMLHAHFVRSPFAHAHIRGIDVDEARRHPGVIAVYTGADIEALTHPFMGFLPLPDLYHPMFFALATDKVRLVGDPVALVIAESRYVAEDAGQLVVVDYEELTPIATIEHALDSTRPAIWPGPGGNVLQRDRRDYGDVDAAFAHADRVVRERFVQHRYSNQPMETRGCVAEVDPTVGTVRYHSATQNSHVMKWSLAALTGRRPIWQSLVEIARQRERMAGLLQKAKAMAAANKASGAGDTAKHAAIEEPMGEGLSAPASPGKAMAQTFLREPVRIAHLARMLLGLLARDPVTLPRVTAQDIGGAFGVKVLPTREDVAVLAAAVDLGRSVKWIEDRNEHLLVAGQAREETLDVEAALRDDGTLLGLRVHITMDQGAYPAFPFSAAMYPMMIRTMLPGPYRLDALGFTTHPHRVEQGDLRRVPRSMGGRDVGARAHARPRRARPRHRSRRDPVPQHHRPRRVAPEDAHRTDARRAHVGARHPRTRAGDRRPRALARGAGGGARRRSVRGPRLRHLHRGRARSARLPGVDHGRWRRWAAGG